MQNARFYACVAALLLTTMALPAGAGDKPAPLLSDFPPDAEICYGRAYDKAHLARHPRQRVTSLYLFRSLTDDPRSEEPPRTREEHIAANFDGESSTIEEETGPVSVVPRTTLKVLVQFKDKREVFTQDVECRPDEGRGFRCGVDCDGGSFNGTIENGALRVRVNGGLRVRSGCTSDDESAPAEHIYADEDAELFRLDSLSIDACHAKRDEARPDWAQSPGDTLLARFASGAGQCFVSGSGLARTTGRAIERLALTTLEPPQIDKEVSQASLRMKLDAKLAKGKAVSKTLKCFGSGYAWNCNAEETGSVRLTRTIGRAITLRESYYAVSELATLLGIEREEPFPPIDLVPADAAQCAFAR